jgi:hypothetical protein
MPPKSSKSSLGAGGLDVYLQEAKHLIPGTPVAGSALGDATVTGASMGSGGLYSPPPTENLVVRAPGSGLDYHQACIAAISDRTEKRKALNPQGLDAENEKLRTVVLGATTASSRTEEINGLPSDHRKQLAHTIYAFRDEADVIGHFPETHAYFNEAGHVFCVATYDSANKAQFTYYNSAGDVETNPPLELIERAHTMSKDHRHNLVYDTEANQTAAINQNYQTAQAINKELQRQKDEHDKNLWSLQRRWFITQLPRLLTLLRDPETFKKNDFMREELYKLAETDSGVLFKELIEKVKSKYLLFEIIGLIVLFLIKLFSNKSGLFAVMNVNVEKFMVIVKSAPLKDQILLTQALLKITGEDPKNRLNNQERNTLSRYWNKYLLSLEPSERAEAEKQAKKFNLDTDLDGAIEHFGREAHSRHQTGDKHYKDAHDLAEQQLEDFTHKNAATQTREQQEAIQNEASYRDKPNDDRFEAANEGVINKVNQFHMDNTITGLTEKDADEIFEDGSNLGERAASNLQNPPNGSDTASQSFTERFRKKLLNGRTDQSSIRYADSIYLSQDATTGLWIVNPPQKPTDTELHAIHTDAHEIATRLNKVAQTKRNELREEITGKFDKIDPKDHTNPTAIQSVLAKAGALKQEATGSYADQTTAEKEIAEDFPNLFSNPRPSTNIGLDSPTNRNPSENVKKLLKEIKAAETLKNLHDAELAAKTAGASATGVPDSTGAAAAAAATSTNGSAVAAPGQSVEQPIVSSASAVSSSVVNSIAATASSGTPAAPKKLTFAKTQEEFLKFSAEFAQLRPLQQQLALSALDKFKATQPAATIQQIEAEAKKIIEAFTKANSQKNHKELAEFLNGDPDFCQRIRGKLIETYRNAGYPEKFELDPKDLPKLIRQLKEMDCYKHLDDKTLEELIPLQVSNMKNHANVIMLEKILLTIDRRKDKNAVFSNGITEDTRASRAYREIIGLLQTNQPVTAPFISKLLFNEPDPNKLSQNQRNYVDGVTHDLKVCKHKSLLTYLEQTNDTYRPSHHYLHSSTSKKSHVASGHPNPRFEGNAPFGQYFDPTRQPGSNARTSLQAEQRAATLRATALQPQGASKPPRPTGG